MKQLERRVRPAKPSMPTTMHSYDLITASDDGAPSSSPAIESYRFRRAEDVEVYAQHNISIGCTSWPETWHLDEDGLLCFYKKGSSLDSIRSWADDSSELEEVRRNGSIEGTCTDQWLIVDSRPSWYPKGPVDEGEAAAFLRLRSTLTGFGVHLLDAVVFDDQQHWWSLQELTTGSTAWPRPAFKLSGGERRCATPDRVSARS